MNASLPLTVKTTEAISLASITLTDIVVWADSVEPSTGYVIVTIGAVVSDATGLSSSQLKNNKANMGKSLFTTSIVKTHIRVWFKPISCSWTKAC